MVQNISLNVLLHRDQTSLMRSYFLLRREPSGGMLIVIGHKSLFMHGAIVILPAVGRAYPFPESDEEEIIVLGMLIFLSI